MAKTPTTLEHAARIVLTALEKADIATDSLIWWDERELLRHALEPSVSPAQALDQELLEALKALLALMDREQPRKLDAALSWRENDERARLMAASAIAKAELRLRAPSRATPEKLPGLLVEWDAEVREHGLWTSGHSIAARIVSALRNPVASASRATSAPEEP